MYKKLLAAILLLGVYAVNAQTISIYVDFQIKSFWLAGDTVKFQKPKQILLPIKDRTDIVTLGQIDGKDIGIQFELIKSCLGDSLNFISSSAFFQKINNKWEMISIGFNKAAFKPITDPSKMKWISPVFAYRDCIPLRDKSIRLGTESYLQYYVLQEPNSVQSFSSNIETQKSYGFSYEQAKTDPFYAELQLMSYSFEGKETRIDPAKKLILEKTGCSEITKIGEINGHDLGVQFEVAKSALGDTSVLISGKVFFLKSDNTWRPGASFSYGKAEFVKIADTSDMRSKGFSLTFYELSFPPEKRFVELTSKERFYFVHPASKDLYLTPPRLHEPRK